MFIHKIPDNFGDFDKQTALELLSLVKKAHNQYEHLQTIIETDPNYNWWDDLTPIEVSNHKYERLANLSFAQYFFLKRNKV